MDNSTSLESFIALSGLTSNTEARRQIPVSAGTFSDLRVRLQVGTADCDLTFTLRVNATDTALACTIANGGTDCSDGTTSVDVDDGDLVVIGSSAGCSEQIFFSLVFGAD